MRGPSKAAFGCAVLLSFAALGGEAEFELKVAGKAYPAVLDKSLKVTTPKGETLEVVVSRKKVLGYAKSGLSFQYPSEMRLSEDSGDGVLTVTLEGTESPLAIVQLYPRGVDAKVVLDALADGVREQFAGRGGQVKALPAPKRTIAGQVRQGRAFQVVLAGEQMESELYAWKDKGKTRGLMLQHMKDDSGLAARRFEVILSSLD